MCEVSCTTSLKGHRCNEQTNTDSRFLNLIQLACLLLVNLDNGCLFLFMHDDSEVSLRDDDLCWREPFSSADRSWYFKKVDPPRSAIHPKILKLIMKLQPYNGQHLKFQYRFGLLQFVSHLLAISFVYTIINNVKIKNEYFK